MASEGCERHQENANSSASSASSGRHRNDRRIDIARLRSRVAASRRIAAISTALATRGARFMAISSTFASTRCLSKTTTSRIGGIRLFAALKKMGRLAQAAGSSTRDEGSSCGRHGQWRDQCLARRCCCQAGRKARNAGAFKSRHKPLLPFRRGGRVDEDGVVDVAHCCADLQEPVKAAMQWQAPFAFMMVGGGGRTA